VQSVADGLRLEAARMVAALSVSDRMTLALRLGARDVALYRTTHGVSDGEARRALARARAVGRLVSRSNDRGDR
jgi:DNA-binding transcriptional regulator YdaS (Cro superfamily)